MVDLPRTKFCAYFMSGLAGVPLLDWLRYVEGDVGVNVLRLLVFHVRPKVPLGYCRVGGYEKCVGNVMSVPYTRELACLVHRDLHGHLSSRRCRVRPLGKLGSTIFVASWHISMSVKSRSGSSCTSV